MKQICWVAGDHSGDAHAAGLMRALLAKQSELKFSGLGGPLMQAAGMDLLTDLTQASAIGPSDALKHFGFLKQARRQFENHIAETKPDLVVLVDFGDFNLPFIAPLVKKQGIRLAYYISPQLWAWGRWRLKYVKRHVDRMIVFFPFEKEFYEREGVPATWVGHPIIEETLPTESGQTTADKLNLNEWRMTVGLLPGSRSSEVRRLLPDMIQAAERLQERMPGLQFVLSQSPNLPTDAYRAAYKTDCALTLTQEPLRNILQTLDAAIVASGTATLQTALHQVPMTVVYKTTWPTFLMARTVLRIPNIALVNVLAQKRLVPELLQHRASGRAIADCMLPLLRDVKRIEAIRQELEAVKNRLGIPGAVGRAAEAIIELL